MKNQQPNKLPQEKSINKQLSKTWKQSKRDIQVTGMKCSKEKLWMLYTIKWFITTNGNKSIKCQS